MKRRPLYSILISALLVLAMLGPKVSAVANMAVGAQGQTIIICTGDGIREITLGENGDPASVSDIISDLCVQVSLDQSLVAPANLRTPFLPPATIPVILARQTTPRAPVSVRLTPVRAPPVV